MASLDRPDPQPAKILVVDDETTIRHLLVELLGDEGYTVLAASNGRAAAEIVERDPPDLIVMDVMMPELDGLATLRLLRTLPGAKAVPVVLMSAARHVSADGASAVAFVPKPFDLDDLLGVVARMLRAAGS